MRKILVFVFIIAAVVSGCNFSTTSTSPESIPTLAATPIPFTPIPTLTQTPEPTITPPAALGTIALDFVALLCNAKWMNGGQQLTVCPDINADHSGGYAVAADPSSEGLPVNMPVLLTIPAINSYSALFLRYPSYTVHAGDRFRAMLQCKSGAPCDVEYSLEYYDAKGKYQSPFLSWKFKSGDAPVNVDVDLNMLANQTIDFVLTLRPNNDRPQDDVSLWIAPHIFRPAR
jgi:hypothetical protein